MSIAYDSFVSAFLDKVKTYEFLKLEEDGRDNIVLGYFRRALSGFKWVCEYDFSLYDAETRCFTDEFKETDIDEIIDIVSEGMIVQWMKPYTYSQENLENVYGSSFQPARGAVL